MEQSPIAARRHGSRSLFDPSPSSCGEGEEHQRLAAADAGTVPWRKWGPYVSERQWGTCREDYGSDGNSWAYLGFQEAHQAAYRWGEDGIAGFCDEEQRLCLSVAMWNGKDPILKERLFGLSGPQGNHGEDVKEMYYYLDATPTNSYLKMLYKYPQKAFPYDEIRRKSATLGCNDPEYELMDTGIFDDDRYFDVTIEYARGGIDDILLRVIATNRGPDNAELHVAPQAFFRNTWSWAEGAARPSMELAEGPRVLVRHGTLGEYHLFAEEGAEVMFCENESNVAALEDEGGALRPFDLAAAGDAPEAFAPPARGEGAATPGAAGACEEAAAAEAAAPAAQERRRLYQASGIIGPGPYKDAFHQRIVLGDEGAVSRRQGTKAGFYTRLNVPAGGSKTVRLRLSRDKLKEMQWLTSTPRSRLA
ncbi:unnamed protein product [Prorocentrum cordatum]|uniref:Uncharacterized protein n=1 Tax=Prorocentrum cordatum TaxID=2364126 RepID=A0ABN9U5V9_9DINO|nr:unnamed protein product [Polarella glacialis]